MDENSTGYFLTLILKLSLYRKLLGLLCLLSGLGGLFVDFFECFVGAYEDYGEYFVGALGGRFMGLCCCC